MSFDFCLLLKPTVFAFVLFEIAFATTLKNQITLDWNNHQNGVYTLDQARKDFGSLTGWDERKVVITDLGKNGTRGCQIKLSPNSLLSGGLVADTKIEPGQEYQVDFDIKFDQKFSWSRGGKVGFGFKIGEGNKTGCRPAWDGNGGSLRLMWLASNNNAAFHPYVYHFKMPNKCGDFFNKTYPAIGNLKKGSWYHISMYAKSNTGNNTDGWVRIIIDNDAPLINEAIQWTANDKYRQINVLTFNTFRGGSTKHWESPTTDYVYYDNLKVKKIS
uniref:Alginate lyase n=1 Tax=Panagrolaimus davidi TaxID=227884 RepID=A0A914PMG5_9BILA